MRTGTKNTYPLLGQLPRALILAVAQQLDDAALVGGQAGDFLDDLADERRALGELAFGFGDAGGWLEGGCFLFAGWVSVVYWKGL